MQDYTHSTAPNRRFPDIVTQRLIKASLDGKPGPYTDNDLAAIASNCTQKGDAARKVEREMSKRISAMAMSNRIGETFDAMITGTTPKGTFVRVAQPHMEGLLTQGAQGLNVGDKLRASWSGPMYSMALLILSKPRVAETLVLLFGYRHCFVSGYRFSDTASRSKSDTPLGCTSEFEFFRKLETPASIKHQIRRSGIR